MKLLKFALLCLCFLLMIGCAHSPNTLKTVYVPTPVKCPAPQIPPKPKLATANLKPDDAPNIVLKAYAADLKALTSYADRLRKILDSYNK